MQHRLTYNNLPWYGTTVSEILRLFKYYSGLTIHVYVTSASHLTIPWLHAICFEFQREWAHNTSVELQMIDKSNFDDSIELPQINDCSQISI